MRFTTNLLLLTLLTTSLSAQITDSIMPTIQKIEEGKGLDPKKYSKAHFQEMADALKLVGQKVRLVTYNMLFDIYDDQQLPENRWPIRAPRIVELLNTMKADILCIQELQLHQLEQLAKAMGEEYAFVFEPNFDLNQKVSQDYDGIFYRKKRFCLVSSKTWSVPQQQKNIPLTMAQLLDKCTNNTFTVFNAHFPSRNMDANEEVVIKIAKIIKPYVDSGKVILAGDMNTIAHRPDLPALPWYNGERAERLLEQSGLVDSQRRAILGHVGPISSFTNAGESSEPFKGQGVPGIILDHFFVSPSIQVLIHANEPARVDGHFPSDHLPVIIDIIDCPIPSQLTYVF